jgi:predicted dehydrogenase
LTTATAAALGTTFPKKLFAQADQSQSPNEKLRCAVVGSRGRGFNHASAYAARKDCEVAYICDADSEVGPRIAQKIAEIQGREPKVVPDMRTIFDDKSVDVVSIATPNHWHSLAGIWAMQAGKDVYVEKPVSHNVSEGRRLVQTARKYGRICQAGTQHRNSGAGMAAIEYMRSGKLGKIHLAHAIASAYQIRKPIGPAGVTYPPPPTVDYNLWAGPAPMAPITRKSFHYDWHWIWDFGNGELGNNGIHAVDLVRWGLGLKGLGRAVMSFGGRVGYEDAGQTPNTLITIHDFDDVTVVQEVRGLKTEPYRFPGEAIFYGTEGIIGMGVNKDPVVLFDPEGKEISRFQGEYTDHFDNFIHCVRNRKSEELKADVLEGHTSSALCHVGNISYRVGHAASPKEILDQLESRKTHENVHETFDRVRNHLADNNVDIEKTQLTLGPWLTIDSEHETFVDNPSANALLTREYRKPFIVPGANEI